MFLFSLCFADGVTSEPHCTATVAAVISGANPILCKCCGNDGSSPSIKCCVWKSIVAGQRGRGQRRRRQKEGAVKTEDDGTTKEEKTSYITLILTDL
ncbi:hypothetical protein L195_g006164 [Trifolium pratense]|uniref:Uncharacterized protein n=1 Tax=Trifolium pratense TaxID=57577 RepID=A0A2K3P2V0_TRIPR|nr:hypothetical protein L195_g006164 [Trifolium pratense]